MAQESIPKDKLLLPPGGRWLIGLGVLISLALGIGGLYLASRLTASDSSTAEIAATTLAPEPVAVSALGRIEPKDAVIKLSPPSSGASFGAPRVEELKVQEGDRVQVNQVLAVLDTYSSLQAAVTAADKEIKFRQAELAKIRAGAKQGELAAQRAEIGRLEFQVQRDIEVQRSEISRLEAQVQRETEADSAQVRRLEAELAGEVSTQQATLNRLRVELQNATVEHERYWSLYYEGAVSASVYDSKRLVMETAQESLREATENLKRIQQTRQQEIQEARARLRRVEETGRQQLNQARATLQRLQETGQQQIQQARATLDQLAEVRPEEVLMAQSLVEQAIAMKEKAQAELATAFVKSPIEGTVLKIHTWPGERVPEDLGILDLGQTNQMYVVAEVYETDIKQIRLGQRSTITSDALPEELTGTVAQIGRQIGKKDVLDTDPAADTDARVVEVKIRLDPESSELVERLTNLQVKVRIFI